MYFFNYSNLLAEITACPFRQRQCRREAEAGADQQRRADLHQQKAELVSVAAPLDLRGPVTVPGLECLFLLKEESYDIVVSIAPFFFFPKKSWLLSM